MDLRQQLEMLQKRERHLENQMAKQDEIAREHVSTNKIGMFFIKFGIKGSKQGEEEEEEENGELKLNSKLMGKHSRSQRAQTEEAA